MKVLGFIIFEPNFFETYNNVSQERMAQNTFLYLEGAKVSGKLNITDPISKRVKLCGFPYYEYVLNFLFYASY